jgi:hypothetical protein
MSLLDQLVDRPLTSGEEAAQRVSVLGGVSVFGLDSLRSVAYGPRTALIVLVPAGIVGLRYIPPLAPGAVLTLDLLSFFFLKTRCSSAEEEGLRSLKSRGNSLRHRRRMMGRRS